MAITLNLKASLTRNCDYFWRLPWLSRDVKEPSVSSLAELPAVGLIDRSISGALRSELGDETFEVIRADFWNDADMMISQIETLMLKGDLDAVDGSLHTLKGAASTLGYVAVAGMGFAPRRGRAAAT